MKKLLLIPFIVLAIAMGCDSQKTVAQDVPAIQNDTIRIANDEIQYEVIIIDAGFGGWFASNAKPKTYYSQSFLEARNRIWVNEWNIRARQPQNYGYLFEMPIDYENNIDYGYDVNYMLYYYLTYFQIKNNIRLGGFRPHI